MEAEAKASGGFIRSTATDVLIASIGKGLQRQRMRVASQLWEAGIAVRPSRELSTCSHFLVSSSFRQSQAAQPAFMTVRAACMTRATAHRSKAGNG